MKREFRNLNASLRTAGDDNALTISGVAASYNTLSRDLGNFREQIAPGAFKRSLREGSDVKCLLNHDPNMVLGRVENGTLKLEERADGLHFSNKLNPASQMHRDLHAAIKRGDISECSFAFTVPSGGDSWDEGNEDGKRFSRRTLRDVNLLDVSCVTYPAYAGATSVSARSLAHYSIRSKAEDALDAAYTKAAEAGDWDAAFLLNKLRMGDKLSPRQMAAVKKYDVRSARRTDVPTYEEALKFLYLPISRKIYDEFVQKNPGWLIDCRNRRRAFESAMQIRSSALKELFPDCKPMSQDEVNKWMCEELAKEIKPAEERAELSDDEVFSRTMF